MAFDTRWLKQRARGWYVILEVPRPLQAVLGKRRFVKSLKTRDLHMALARRHAALAAFQREIAAARRRTAPAPAVASGMAWRAVLAGIERGDPEFIGSTPTEVIETAYGDATERTPQTVADDMARTALEAAYDDLERRHGAAEAETFLSVALGRATPLLHHVNAWLAEGGPRGPVAPRTQAQYRSDLTALEAWANETGIPATIEAFTRAAVGRYVTAMVANGVDRKTANRKISAASSYWRWLVKRTGMKDNPWSGQSLSKFTRGEQGERRKRPFTNAEVATLLAGGADPELADVMRVAALTGARIEELYRLTVADCVGGWFNIRRSKTAAGRRRVPINSALTGIVARRTTTKAPGDFLFPEPGPAREGPRALHGCIKAVRALPDPPWDR